jgi:putative DNA primase/helicase
MIMTNELPEIRDVSGALANRFIILTLKKSWLNEENPLLLDSLRKELPGILFWALEGLIRLRNRGRFVQPSSSTQAMDELEAVTSPIRAFVKENCTLSPQKTISVQTLYGAWSQWCHSMGDGKPGNIQSFGKKIHAAFPQIDTCRPSQDLLTRGPRYYIGICLNLHKLC